MGGQAPRTEPHDEAPAPGSREVFTQQLEVGLSKQISRIASAAP